MSRLENSYQEISDQKKDAQPGQSLSSQVHRAKLISIGRIIL